MIPTEGRQSLSLRFGTDEKSLKNMSQPSTEHYMCKCGVIDTGFECTVFVEAIPNLSLIIKNCSL